MRKQRILLLLKYFGMLQFNKYSFYFWACSKNTIFSPEILRNFSEKIMFLIQQRSINIDYLSYLELCACAMSLKTKKRKTGSHFSVIPLECCLQNSPGFNPQNFKVYGTIKVPVLLLAVNCKSCNIYYIIMVKSSIFATNIFFFRVCFQNS